MNSGDPHLIEHKHQSHVANDEDNAASIAIAAIIESIIFKNTGAPVRPEAIPLEQRETFCLQSIQFTDFPHDVKELHWKLAAQVNVVFTKKKDMFLCVYLLLRGYRPQFFIPRLVPAATFWLASRENMVWMACTMSAEQIRLLYEQACELGGELASVNLRSPDVIQRLNDVCGTDIGLVPLEADETKYKVDERYDGLRLLIPIRAK